MIMEQPILTSFVWLFYRLSWLLFCIYLFIFLWYSSLPLSAVIWYGLERDRLLSMGLWAHGNNMLKEDLEKQYGLAASSLSPWIWRNCTKKTKQTTTKTTERQWFGLSMRRTLIYSWASAAIMFLWMDFWFTNIARFHSYDEIYVFKCEYVFSQVRRAVATQESRNNTYTSGIFKDKTNK